MSVTTEPGQIFVDPAAYADADEWHRSAAWLRRESPIHRVEVDGFRPFWAVTRHADVMAIERRADEFLNGDDSVVENEELRLLREQLGPGTRSLVNMNGAEHRAYRAATARWFQPAVVRERTARVAELANAAMDCMVGLGGTCDFVADVAVRYPLAVIMEILGVPPEDEPRMLRLTQELFGSADPDLARGGDVTDVVAVLKDFRRYFTSIAEDRRAQPTDDLATVIANALIDGEPMGRLETLSYFVLVATAGHDTTSSSIAGGMDALLRHPEQLALLRAQPELLVGATDEIIRWATPVTHFMRTAAVDAEVSGHAFRAGDWILLSYLSANRDDDVFENPFRFDIRRSNAAEHLAFGFGAHFCLGAHLAKLEIRELFRAVLARVSHIEAAGPTERSHSTFVGGPKKLPVRYRMSDS